MNFDLGSILPSAVNLGATYLTGNPALGQIAADFASSILGDSANSGSLDFNSVFNAAYGRDLLSNIGG